MLSDIGVNYVNVYHHDLRGIEEPKNYGWIPNINVYNTRKKQLHGAEEEVGQNWRSIWMVENKW